MASAARHVTIVIIHGIGEPPTAGTVMNWARPIRRAIQAVHGAGSVKEGRVSLSTDPAEVNLLVNANGMNYAIRLIEARWSGAFPQPKVLSVLVWAAMFAPTAAIRACRNLMRGPRSTARMVSEIYDFPNLLPLPTFVRAILIWALGRRSNFLVALALLPIAAIVVSVPATIILVPMLAIIAFVGQFIPGRRKAARRLLMTLRATAGDAYTFRKDPILRKAMLDRIEDVLVTSFEESATTILLAHSQGAALAMELLTRAGTPEPDVLITVGSGTQLLKDVPTPTADLIASKPNMRWINVWSQWDPVPSGPMADTNQASRSRWESLDRLRLYKVPGTNPPSYAAGNPLTTLLQRLGIAPRQPLAPVNLPGPEEWQVHNRSSLLSDHTSYQRNFPEVATRVAHLATDPTWSPGEVDHEWHVIRVRQLALARVLWALACVLIPASLLTKNFVSTVQGWNPAWTHLAGRISMWPIISSYPIMYGILTLLLFVTACTIVGAIWTQWEMSFLLSPSKSRRFLTALFVAALVVPICVVASLTTIAVHDWGAGFLTLLGILILFASTLLRAVPRISRR